MPLTIVDCAYVAGIIDGEGSISITKSQAARTHCYFYPYVRVANTDIRLIEYLEKTINCGSVKYYKSSMNERCKPVHHIGWVSNEATELLVQVVPYLVIKKERAERVIALDTKTKNATKDKKFGNGNPVPEWLIKERVELYNWMKEQNKRGV